MEIFLILLSGITGIMVLFLLYRRFFTSQRLMARERRPRDKESMKRDFPKRDTQSNGENKEV